MARRTWEQAFAEELPKLEGLLVEATDDIRHKVIEQAWSGQEQTGYNQNIYGYDPGARDGYRDTLDEAGHRSYFEHTKDATPVEGIFREDFNRDEWTQDTPDQGRDDELER